MSNETVPPPVNWPALIAWTTGRDTGLSSLAMARHLFGVGTPDPCFGSRSHPLDPSDFGRCYRFLRAVPEAVSRLPRMAEVSPTWARLIAAWPELEATYEAELPSGTCPKLYARMKELRC